MVRLTKKILRGIEAEANRIKKIYESPNAEVEAIIENLRKEIGKPMVDNHNEFVEYLKADKEEQPWIIE